MRQKKNHMPRHAIVCRGEWLRSAPQFWSKQDWNPALVCVPLLEGNLAKCDVSYTHFTIFASNVHALLLFSWWFHDSSKRIFFTPTSKPQSFTLGFQRASYLIWNGPMLRKTSIFLANKQRSTGFDEAPPKIYQRDFHKWYKIHDTLRISRFQNWWCSRSQKNPPKHQSQTPSIGGSNRWLPLDAAPTPLQLARSWTSWTMEVRNKLMTKR